MKKEPFIRIFYSWRYSNDHLTDEEFGRLIRGIMNYSINREDPILPGIESKSFYKIKPNIDRQLSGKYMPRGKEHWNWKGGKTPKNQKERSSARYFKWRTAVFARDRFTCQICGKVGGELNAHHIRPWAKYEELRFDVNNGVTLCESCHKKLHRGK